MWYDGHHFWGMHWIWWILWVIFLIWIFATPWDIPGQRTKKDTPLTSLKIGMQPGKSTPKNLRSAKKQF